MGSPNWVYILKVHISVCNIMDMWFTSIVVLCLLCGVLVKGVWSHDLFCNITRQTMDCTARHVKIKDICHAVEVYNITVLYAGENNMGTITRKDLKGCEQLKKLDLHFNQMSNIMSDTFSDFVDLKELDLRANDLGIYGAAFDQSVLPKSLEVLYIGGNFKGNGSVTTQYPNISQLKSLRKLYMDGFEADFGHQYRTLDVQNVSLSASTMFTYCNLTHITNTTFANLLSVQALDLSCCSIKWIAAGAFQNLTRLEWLDLSLNKKLGLNPLAMFTYGLQFTNIRFLNYSYVIPTFGAGVTVWKAHLCYLYNTSLEVLVLDSDRIVSVETNALMLTPTTLNELHYNDNKFTFGPYVSQLGCLRNVTHTYGNNQSQYHSPVRYLIDGEDSDDSDCQQPAPKSECPFMTDDYLQTLSTSECKFIKKTDLESMFSPTFPKNVKHLEFTGCNMNYRLNVQIEVNPVNNSLEYADLSGNSLYSLSAPIGPFPNIKILKFSENYCEEIQPIVFKYMTTLQYLDLSKNFLGPFLADSKNNNVFKELKSLQVLHLDGNKITTLNAEIFTPLVQLKILSLNSNNIKQFQVHLQKLPNILHLDLGDNFLPTITETVRHTLNRNSKHLNTNFSLNIEHNEIKFDCNNTDFLEWMLDNEQYLEHFENYTYDPEKYKLNSTSLDLLRQSCKSYTLIIVLCSIGIAVFISVVIVGVIYRNRWKLRYFLYMSRTGLLSFNRRPGYTNLEDYEYDAFISYAEENIRFIKTGIIPTLEGQGLNLCVHQRDFIAGKAITDNIINAIKKSRKTVVILSKVFLKKKWCMYEFNMARMESIYSREDNYLIIVLLEDVPARDMPLEMLKWIRDDSYIRYPNDGHGQTLFWNNLTDAFNA